MKKNIFIIIFLWLLIISSFVFVQEFTLHTGKEVLLKTVPVDPRDLLRGDYVILNYEIAQLHGEEFPYNSTVYMILDTDENNIAYDKYISFDKPSDRLYLKGKVGKCDTNIPLYKSGKCVNFGIESYFVKEGYGKDLEQDLREGALVKVVIDRNGYAKVKGFVK